MSKTSVRRMVKKAGGVPVERVAERVNPSIEVLLQHYDLPNKMAEMRERRRPYLDRLSFDDEEGENQ